MAVDYDTLAKDWAWTLSANKHITDRWLVGTSMTTYAPEYGFKLDYEVFTEFKYKDISLRITDWCDHWFSQSGKGGWLDE